MELVRDFSLSWGLGCPQQAKRAAAGGEVWNEISERISRSIACMVYRNKRIIGTLC